MKKKEIHTNKAGKSVGPYSQAIEYNGIIYVSGVTAIDPLAGLPIGTVEDQTEKILINIKEILETAGSSMDKILKVTIFLKDVNDFSKVNAFYYKYF